MVGRLRHRPAEASTKVKKTLKQATWRWPRFDSFLKQLVLDDLWPMPWHHYRERARAGSDMTAARAQIFLTTVRSTADSIQRSRDQTFMVMLRLEGWHLYTDSEVGAHYVQAQASGVDPRDWKTWPPLYPGDLSRIDRGTGGVFSRFGPLI